MAGTPFQRVAVNVIGPLPTADNGKRFILVLINYYTKCEEAYDAVDYKVTTVANIITYNWIAQHGVSLSVHRDNDP